MGKEDRTLLSITDHDGLIETTFDSRSPESFGGVVFAIVSLLMECKPLLMLFCEALMAAMRDPEEFKKNYSTISSPPWVD